MKKSFIGVFALLALLRLDASAGGEFFVAGGQNSVTVANSAISTTSTVGTIGYGGTGYFDNGIMAGVSLFVGGANSDDLFYGADARLGYSIANIGVYGIYSAIGQILGANSKTNYGFGPGAGIEYKWEKVAIAVEYKKYAMETTTIRPIKYDLTQAAILLKYRF